MSKSRVNEILNETNPERQLCLSRALRSDYLKRMEKSGLGSSFGLSDGSGQAYSFGAPFEGACDAVARSDVQVIAGFIKAAVRPH